MNKYIFVFQLCFISISINAQSKKVQISQLNFRVDSIQQTLNEERKKCEGSIYELNNQLSKCNIGMRDLKIELGIVNKNLKNKLIELDGVNQILENKTIELEKIAKSLELLKLKNSSWSFDTLRANDEHTCYYYESHFPYIISSSLSDTSRKNINEKIRETSFKVPAVMNNEDYKSFRKCDEGDYNHSKPEHNQHVIYDECSWCQSSFFSDVMNIEQSKYVSILMEVGYQMGGNWSHQGYNSVNFKNNEIIKIPSNPSVKNKLVEEIKEYLIKNPMIDEETGNKYPILNEIMPWSIDDLTFYFKNDTLRLIFSNGAHGNSHQILDIPLPKLQQHLNL
jgi:hypothetical protein